MTTDTQEAALSWRVYTIMRRRILCGALAIGQPVSRRDVATEMKVSLLPVGGAFQRLELEGLLESRPRVGTRVRVLSEDEIRGHYVVLEALEVQAAIRVATVATSYQLHQLRTLQGRRLRR